MISKSKSITPKWFDFVVIVGICFFILFLAKVWLIDKLIYSREIDNRPQFYPLEIGVPVNQIRIIDGDTFELENGDIVHLLGIDCSGSEPNAKAKRDEEFLREDTGATTKMGKEATKFVRDWYGAQYMRLGSESRVYFEYDTQKRDKHGRLLAYVYYPYYTKGYGLIRNQMRKIINDKPCIMLNAWILERGYAKPMPIPPNVKYSELFEELYQEAKENKRGLWREGIADVVDQ
ncbi:MAG: thermonuclease family protein [Candidatus Omnitrophota bacterium]